MSFGFSIGDFITVIELANAIRKDFSGAPKQYHSIAEEVKNLTSVLQDIDTFAAGNDVTSQEANLCSIVENCYTILKQIKNTLDKYSSLDSGKTQARNDIQAGRTTFRGRVRRIWEQVRFEPDEIRDFRLEINSNVNLLNTAIGTLTRDNVIKLVVQQERQENHAILDWLAPSDYAAQQSSYIGLRLEGSGKWLLESSDYQEWIKSNDTVLFLQGIPGAGKTVLSSIVVEHLQQKCQEDPNIRLCYFYCDFNRSEKQQLDNIMLALLRQLSEHSAVLPPPVKDLYMKHQAHSTRPSLSEIKTTIRTVLGALHLYLIVDALDECQTSTGCQGRLITEILDLRENVSVHVMVTTRPIPQILDRFRACDSCLAKVEVLASEDDVRRYIDIHIEELPRFVIESPELQVVIKDSIVEAVEGMFLLVKLHLESLKGTTTKKSLRKVLQSFRQGRGGYTEAYSKTMETISQKHQSQRDLAIEAITWIVHARRPLKAAEFLHALAIEIGEPEFDKENVPDLREVISMCCGLITMEVRTETMRLIHYTTQEFFEGQGSCWLQEFHAGMYKSCIAYLSLDSFGVGRCPSEDSFVERLVQYPFYDYVSCHWGFHVTSEADLAPILRFLDLSQNIQATVQALLEHGTFWIATEDYLWTGLHLITYFGLQGLVQQTLHMWDLQSKDSQGRTALAFAAIYDHEAICRILIDHGADINSIDDNGTSILTGAILRKHIAISRLLVQKGANIEIRNDRKRTPIMTASRNNLTDIVELLLEKGADIDAVDHYGDTALLHACHGRHNDIARILIDHGAQVDIANNLGYTALMRAAGRDSTNIVKLLIDRGCQVSAADKHGYTALMVACTQGNERMARLLIENGARLEDGDYYGQTALTHASSLGHETLVRLLIDHGARIDIVGKDGYTALMFASKNGIKSLVQLLIDNGARLDDVDNLGYTALKHAVEWNHRDVIKLLIERGAQPDDSISQNEMVLEAMSTKPEPVDAQKTDDAVVETTII